MKFSMMHGGAKHIDVLDSIIEGAISPRADGSQGLSAEDAEDISNLYLEVILFVCTELLYWSPSLSFRNEVI